MEKGRLGTDNIAPRCIRAFEVFPPTVMSTSKVSVRRKEMSSFPLEHPYSLLLLLFLIYYYYYYNV